MTSPANEPDMVPTCNTADMALIHKVFRHRFREAHDLVRGVGSGDIERSGIVGAYVQDLLSGLHRHHEGEDLLLWDTLEQRSPGCAIHVSLMKSQHAELATLIGETEAALPAWETTADQDARDKVAMLVERIGASLETHLGQEEALIVPVAASNMAQKEWDRIGEHARAAIPKNEQFIQLGWIVDALGPQDGSQFLQHALPAPVRVLWGVVGKRQFARRKKLVYGH